MTKQLTNIMNCDDDQSKLATSSKLQLAKPVMSAHQCQLGANTTIWILHKNHNIILVH